MGLISISVQLLISTIFMSMFQKQNNHQQIKARQPQTQLQSNNARQLLTGQIEIYNTRCQKNLTASFSSVPITKLLIIPDTSLIVLVQSTKLLIRSIETGDDYKSFQNQHDLPVEQIIFCYLKSIIVTVSKDQTLRGWSIDQSSLLSLFITYHQNNSVPLLCVVNMPSTEIVITGHSDNTLSVWNMTAAIYFINVYGPFAEGVLMKRINTTNSSTESITAISHYCCAKASYSNQVLTGSSLGKVRIWDYHTQALLREKQICQQNTNLQTSLSITHMTVVNNTELILMACSDFTVLALDVALNEVAQYFRGHTAPITAIVSISYDPLYFASGSQESIRVWQIPTYSVNNDAAKNENGVMVNIITNKDGVNDLQIFMKTQQLVSASGTGDNQVLFQSHLVTSLSSNFIDHVQNNHTGYITDAFALYLSDNVTEGIRVYIVSASTDSQILMQEYEPWGAGPVTTFNAHTKSVSALQCIQHCTFDFVSDQFQTNNDNLQLFDFVSAGNDNFIFFWNANMSHLPLWNISTLTFLKNISVSTFDQIQCMDYLETENLILAAGTAGQVRAWQLPAQQDTQQFVLYFNIHQNFDFSPLQVPELDYFYKHNLPITALQHVRVDSVYFPQLVNATNHYSYTLILSASQEQTIYIYNITGANQLIQVKNQLQNINVGIYVSCFTVLPLFLDYATNHTILDMVIGYNQFNVVNMIRCDLDSLTCSSTYPTSPEYVHKPGGITNIILKQSILQNTNTQSYQISSPPLQLISSGQDYQIVTWNITRDNVTLTAIPDSLLAGFIASKTVVSLKSQAYIFACDNGINVYQPAFPCVCNDTLTLTCPNQCNAPLLTWTHASTNTFSCVDSCPQTTYQLKQHCLPCDDLCATCKGPLYEDCIECVYEFDPASGFCASQVVKLNTSGVVVQVHTQESNHQGLIIAFIVIGTVVLIIVILIACCAYKAYQRRQGGYSSSVKI